MSQERLPVIKVVGVSGSGKSTLVACLRARGYDARSVSQEHSEVPDLWRRFDRPSVLIYLSVDLRHQAMRRPHAKDTYTDLAREQVRLAHARDAADLRIDTSRLNPRQVCDLATIFLQRIGVARAEKPLAPARPTGSARRKG